tara:strand:- start:275 stop:685 length:411 start_codon:yes stop_codon:yes gene_type:complete
MNKVRVYWNLHKKIWSIQDTKTGLVIDHKDSLVLDDGAKFIVRKGGQKRVRQEGKKYVHAFAVGYIYEGNAIPYVKGRLHLDWDRVKYNPYDDDYFMHQRHDDNQYKPKEWKEIPRDWTGWILLESTENGNPKVYI